MREKPELDIETAERAGYPVVRVRGIVDFRTSPRLRSALRRWVEKELTGGIINLTGVQKIDTTGVATIAETMQDMGGSARLVLVNDSSGTRRALELSGMADCCERCSSEDDAAAILEGGGQGGGTS